MRVGELIQRLQGIDPTVLVVMSSDTEGNRYSPLSNFYDGLYYIKESNWGGEICDPNEEDEDEYYDDEEENEEDIEKEVEYRDCAGQGGEPCIVFYPTN